MSQTIRRDDRDGVVVLTLDNPGRSVNVVDEALLTDLRQHLDVILGDGDVHGVVLASAKSSGFGVGADVSWLPTLAARADAEDYLADVHDLMLRMVRATVPIVTAVHGAAMGGALEVALAGHAIVAAPGAALALPEVTLSLLPGGGGTQLLRRWVSPSDVVDLLVTGRRLSAGEAHDVGLVDEVVDEAKLLDRAVSLARDGRARRPAEPTVDLETALDAIEERRTSTERKRRVDGVGRRILDVVEAGVRGGTEAGLRAERDVFLELLRSPAARAALHLFEAEREVARRSRGDGPTVERLGVVGGGQMGAGIAATAASKGLPTVVRDISDDALDRARAYLDRVLARGAGDDLDVDTVWTATTDMEDVAQVDAVIEAVFEDPDLKSEVLGDLTRRTGEDTLIATNTSAISIARLAEHVERPERFLGMHFFSPVERMPLVELVPHATTAPTTLARAASLGRRLGKVPVVVGDAPGFFTSRVYARWLIEGVRLLLDGIDPGDVDRAAKGVGFPAGPFLAHDEATLGLVVQASITQVADNVMADRLDVGAVRAALQELVDAGIRGRRHGEGFYTYDDDGRRGEVNPRVREILDVAPAEAGEEEIANRLLLAFATECYLTWDDGTLCHPDDGDVASVLGIGFPRALGGPFHWTDEVGPARVHDIVTGLDEQAFPLGETLPRLISAGETFHDQSRRDAPFT